jgi:hypothetical protein
MDGPRFDGRPSIARQTLSVGQENSGVVLKLPRRSPDPGTGAGKIRGDRISRVSSQCVVRGDVEPAAFTPSKDRKSTAEKESPHDFFLTAYQGYEM